MKILHAIQALYTGGAERVLVDLSNLQAQEGLDVDVLCLIEPGEFAADLHESIRVHSLDVRSRYNPLYLWKLYRILRRYDIVHVHTRNVLRYLYLCKTLFRLKTPFVFHDHFGAIELDRSYTPLLKKAIQNSTYIGVSKALTQWAAEDLAATDVHLLSNIIIPEEPVATPSRPPGDRQKRIIKVANIRRQKNIEFALDLVAELNAASGEEFRLDIIGKAVDQAYYDELLARVRRLHLEEQVRFIHDCSKVQPLLKNYDLAIHTARSETGPLVIMEYMAQQVPFLAYDTGQVIRQIRGDFPDLILSDFDLTHWKGAVQNLLNANGAISHRLREVFDQRYSPKNYVNRCMKIYRELQKSS